MYYKYLDREQQYLRSYRTHNLWFDQYQKKVRTPRVTAYHLNFLKRMGKSYSGHRIVANIWGFTAFAMVKFFAGFTSKKETDPNEAEVYFRLQSIFIKNKYGYNTRFMSDFDLLLEGVLNERFIDESTTYYDDPSVVKEIEDMELGLNGEFAEEDIKNLLKDKGGHASRGKTLRYPGRVADNYQKSDDLSCYKVHPSGSKPAY